MSVCSCYAIRLRYRNGHNVFVSECLGTKEIDECSCGGDTDKCDFYPEKREKSLKALGEKKMAKYINADDAVKDFEEWHGQESEILNLYNADWIIRFLEGLPAADVQKVRHGRWREDEETGCLQCSECGHYTDEILGDFIKTESELIHCSMRPAYCSKCGAKMDGGDA